MLPCRVTNLCRSFQSLDKAVGSQKNLGVTLHFGFTVEAVAKSQWFSSLHMQEQHLSDLCLRGLKQ